VGVASSGLYVVAESVIGALWVIHLDGSITEGIFPDSGVPIAALGSRHAAARDGWRDSVQD
jgi:hypothetical protein